ncbi:MAG: hypothetical protein IJF84_13625 [Thermoguttaceae bacterium]|nr:hypothetical protein [Thermoguttaceae bacterium]
MNEKDKKDRVQEVFISVASPCHIYRGGVSNQAEPNIPGFPRNRHWLQMRVNVLLRVHNSGIPAIELGKFNVWHSGWKWRFETHYDLCKDVAANFPELEGMFVPDKEFPSEVVFSEKYKTRSNEQELAYSPNSDIFIVKDMGIAPAFQRRGYMRDALRIFESAFTDVDSYIIIPFERMVIPDGRKRLEQYFGEIGYYRTGENFLVRHGLTMFPTEPEAQARLEDV